MRVGVVPFPLGATFANLERSCQAAEETGFHALWTIDHATPTVDLRPAWEASSLLVAMAARTRTISIGVLVFDVLLRHPFIVAGAIAVAQTLSAGRVRVGLGIGDRFSQLDHEAIGVPFPSFAERVRFLEACCTVLPALWRGGTVSEPLLGLDEAALGPLGIAPPPLIVAGGSPRLMEVAARHAQGWNLFTQQPDEFAARVHDLAGVEASAGREEPLGRSVYFFVERVERDLRDVVEEFEAAGAEEAMLVVMNPSRDAILDVARKVL